MYTTCIFCHEPLGANETIEHFPIGRRLAFDSAKGRLWVVCRNCAQWNLTPLEERWEAVEECERAFRSVRTRVSTPEIGLARTPEGLDLVRIGAPLRPEFAAWRFGDRFGVRRRQSLRAGARAAVMPAAACTIVAVGTFAPGIVPVVAPALAAVALIASRVVVTDRRVQVFPRPLKLTADDGTRLELGQQAVANVQMRADDTPLGFRLGMDIVEMDRTLLGPAMMTRHVALSGKDAMRAARLVLPRINGFGATRKVVQDAVDVIERVGFAERFIPHALSIVRKAGLGYSPIQSYPTPIRLGIEMVLHEEAERRAMEGELAELDAAWREAERVAGIADDLLLPSHVNVFLNKHRKR